VRPVGEVGLEHRFEEGIVGRPRLVGVDVHREHHGVELRGEPVDVDALDLEQAPRRGRTAGRCGAPATDGAARRRRPRRGGLPGVEAERDEAPVDEHDATVGEAERDDDVVAGAPVLRPVDDTDRLVVEVRPRGDDRQPLDVGRVDDVGQHHVDGSGTAS
jgi:hypothetical protein